MLLNSPELANIQITCPKIMSMHRSVVTRSAVDNSSYKVIKLSDITLKDLVDLRNFVAKLPGSGDVGVSCVQGFGDQALQSSLGRTLLTKLKKGPFVTTVLEQGSHYSSELVGASNAKALLEEIIGCVGQDLQKSSGGKLREETNTTPLGALVDLRRSDLVSARKIGYSPTQSVDDPQGQLQREMSARLLDIVNKVQLTKVTQGQMFGKTVKMQRLADMTLSQLEDSLAYMKDLSKIDSRIGYGVSSANQQDQDAMNKLGISAPQGAMDGNYANGAELGERNSLERIITVLRRAALACADAGKLDDPKKTTVGELASTYLNDTPAGKADRAIVSQEAEWQDLLAQVDATSAKAHGKDFGAGGQKFQQSVAKTQRASFVSRLGAGIGWLLALPVVLVRAGYALFRSSGTSGAVTPEVPKGQAPSCAPSADLANKGGVVGMTSQQTADARVRVQQRRERRDQNPARPEGRPEGRPEAPASEASGRQQPPQPGSR